MMKSKILKYVDFTKTQKSRYLENETLFSSNKKIINHTSRATLLQKIPSFVEEFGDDPIQMLPYNQTMTVYITYYGFYLVVFSQIIFNSHLIFDLDLDFK